MFIRLQKSPTSKRVQVHLVENYRDGRGKSRQRILRNYGEQSELEARDADIIEKLKIEARELTRQKREARVWLEIDCLRERRFGEHALTYGHFFLEAIYRKLGLPAFFKGVGKKSKAAYEVNSIAQLLIFSRVLKPASKAATFASKGDYLADFDFNIHDVYRALDDLDGLADDLQLHVHQAVSRHYGRDAALVFYDVTNYYFECDFADDLRKKGASKELKQDPIIQMGLLIDAAGLPIAYRLFPGNTHDSRTLVPVLLALKERYGFKRIVVVADKGLNGGENLAFITQSDDGYIVSQKVRGKVAPEITRALKDREGWTFDAGGTFGYKSFIRQHRLAKGVTIAEKVVCYWSAQYARREACRRGELIDGIEYLVSHPKAYDAKNDYGRKRYVKEALVTPGGEIVEKRLFFNEARFTADAELDGFYCILTSETAMSEIDVIDRYHDLVRIEDAFRVIKSDLEGRPVFVWTRPRINAHFLVCFLALVLVRILQARLGYACSAKALKDALTSATATPLEKGIYVIDETTATYQALEKSFGVSLPNRYAPVEVLKAYRKNILAGA